MVIYNHRNKTENKQKGDRTMFESLASFSVFFFSVAALLLIGILFEEKFLALEDKYDKRKENIK